MDAHTAMGPMACLALGLGLAAEGAALRGHAQEALIAVITDGRLVPAELGATLSRLLDTGFNKLCRWAKSLGEVARVSAGHAAAVAALLQHALAGDPKQAPRDTSALLELLVELQSQTGTPLQVPATRTYLAALTAGGKTARLVKQLLRA